MTPSIQQLYREYLRRETPLEKVRDWLALNQWELHGLEEELADEVDVALAHLDDGYGDEEHLRSRLAFVLAKHTVQTVQLDILSPHASSSPIGTAGAAPTISASLVVAA